MLTSFLKPKHPFHNTIKIVEYLNINTNAKIFVIKHGWYNCVMPGYTLNLLINLRPLIYL